MSASAFAQEQTDSLVRLMSAQMIEQYEINHEPYRKVTGPARFLHNNTYLICDTAVQDVNRKAITAWGHVQLIQDETVLTSERINYYVDSDLAEFRGAVVQLQDKDGNILRTRHLDYNTKDSVAIFRNGASMKSGEDQIIESLDGTYESKIKLFTFEKEVNMYTDSIFIRTSKLQYLANENKAIYETPLDAWKDGNMISADDGWYNREDEELFFRNNVHFMTQNQEGWTDSLHFFRNTNNVLADGISQLRDTTRNVISMARKMEYVDSVSTLRLKREVSVMAITEQEEKRDTVYFGADTVIYHSIPRCDIDSLVFKASEDRLAAINTDPVSEYRQKAFRDAQQKREEARKAADEKAGLGNVKDKQEDKDAEEPAANRRRRRTTTARQEETTPPVTEEAPPVIEETETIPPVTDSLTVSSNFALSDSLSLANAPALTDSLAVSDSLALKDSLALTDSLAVSDSLAFAQRDTTKMGFVTALGNIKIWREDLQVACDSLSFNDLDSLARFYKSPVIWNDLNRQYSADSVSVLIQESHVRKASLMSNAFVAIKEDENLYDQIKGAEVLAYFDTTMALTRFDGLGDPQAMFYLQENGAFATVNKVSAKMMSGYFKDGTIETVAYYDSPDNDAYPVVQLPKADRFLKGFKWEPERRPVRDSILTQEIRQPERNSYARREYPSFNETVRYFPGDMDGKFRLMEAYKNPQRRQRSQPQPGRETPSAELSDTLARLDSIAAVDLFKKDSIAVALDTTSIAMNPADTAAVASPADSIAVELQAPVVVETKPLSKKELRAMEQARKQAERELKWARLDSLDAVKAAKKEQKRLEKQRKRTYKKLLQNQKEAAREDALLQKYIEKYRRKKEKQDARKHPEEVVEKLFSGE